MPRTAVLGDLGAESEIILRFVTKSKSVADEKRLENVFKRLKTTHWVLLAKLLYGSYGQILV